MQQAWFYVVREPEISADLIGQGEFCHTRQEPFFVSPFVHAIGSDKVVDSRQFTIIAEVFARTNRFEYIKVCALGGPGTPVS